MSGGCLKLHSLGPGKVDDQRRHEEADDAGRLCVEPQVDHEERTLPVSLARSSEEEEDDASAHADASHDEAGERIQNAVAIGSVIGAK